MRRPLLIEHIQYALHSLRLTRTRTLLTTLGLTIGVASIVAILAISSSITNVIGKQVGELGGNLALIRPVAPGKDINFLMSPLSQQSFATSTLSEADYTTIADLPGVEAAAPIMTINGSLKAGTTTVSDGTIVATTPSFIQTSPTPIRDGQFLDSITDRDTAVIGSQLAIDLFGTDLPIGQDFVLRGQPYTVIGVLKKVKNPVNYNNVDLDRTVIISLESGKNLHHGQAQIQQINLKADSGAKLTSVVQKVDAQLERNHKGEKDYVIVHGDDVATPTGRFFESMIALMTAIAAISLVVGGIGIMNIMLVGVVERTREIGLRKAVGASSANIVGQFMTEALIISLLGGVAGVTLGYTVAYSVGAIVMMTPTIQWQIIVAGLAVSIIAGGLFGLYPAIRAALKDPIESLRQYH